MSPTLALALRDLARQARRDPTGTYDAIYELVEALTSPAAEPFARPARTLGLAISRGMEDYARSCDELAEQPELPLAVGDR